MEIFLCPFCRGEAKIRREKYWQPKVSFNIICTVCYSSSGWYPTADSAISAWNTRSEPSIVYPLFQLPRECSKDEQG